MFSECPFFKNSTVKVWISTDVFQTCYRYNKQLTIENQSRSQCLFLEDHQRTRETKTAHAPLLRFHEKVSRFGNNGDLKIEVIRHFPRTGNVCGLRFTFVPLDQTPEVSHCTVYLHSLENITIPRLRRDTTTCHRSKKKEKVANTRLYHVLGVWTTCLVCLSFWVFVNQWE